ncbi:hypothetical protein APSETT444_008013 [Aspergillus pseudonomiae]
MASQLKPPPGGKTVVIFGCQCVSFTIDDFHRLRATVLGTPEHRWIQDVLSELPVYYRTAATTYVQKLQNIPGTQQLRDLAEWFRTGEVPTDSFPLTYIQLAPILMITHFVEYWQYLRLGHPKSPTSGNEPLTEGSVVEIVGFCIGFLSAAVVSVASNQEELWKYGAVALRLATLMGAIGDAQEREEEYTSLATVWKSADLEKRLPLILEPFAESYVTVRFDANRATIMTPRQTIKQLEEALQSAGFNTTRVEFNGRYHWAGNEDIVHALCRMCDSDPALQLPGASQSVDPTRPGISMDRARQGPLHEFVLRSILAQQCQWLDTFRTVYQAHLEDTSSIIVEFGPERCIPPTYMRKLRGRTVHFADLDLSPFSRTSPLHQTPRSYDSDIAVVGMACRVAGADDLEEFWKLLCSGESQHQEMPLERYRNYETPWRPGAIKPWFGNFVRDIDAFDHKFFKKVPREAMSQDPQQRLLLQVAYQAVQQSGYFHQSDINRNIGCYIASCTVDYEHNVNCNPVSAYSATGLLRSFMAGKLSHYFGWRGPAFCVDSACSGSAVALHQACQSIIRGECTAALVGGANAIMSPLAYDNLAGASFVSPTGPCKPFDANADGYCRGEGFAAIFIKKMSEALASGDIILGTIASTAVEQNSNCTPIVVPDACSLAGLFTQVTRQAHLHPRDISVVEAHGTGTQAGDPAEYVSIRKALAGPQRTTPLALGSVKGLIGHTEGVSGLVSLVKILLMINEGKIPPQPNFHTLNRHIEASPDDQMHISMTLKDWTAGFRAALINNYGASGSNASMVITEAPAIIRDGWGPDPGAMIVVEGNKDDVILLIDDAYRRGPKHIGPATIACFNGPSNFTLAGATAAIDAVQATLKAPEYASLKAKRLCVANAFHSGLVEPLLPAVKGVMSGINPQQPIILCERATRNSCTATMSSSTVAEHLREPVYFHHAVQRLEERYGPCVWVEAGSNSTITVMVSRALSSSSGHHFQAVNITSRRGMQSLSDSTVSLWKASVSVTFWAHHPRQSRDYAPILLPPYQFDKSRHWLSNKSLPGPSHEVGTRPAIDASALRFVGYQDSQQLVARFNIDISHPQYQELIAGHVVSHTAPVAPASLMLDYVVEALRRFPECKGRIPQVQNVTSDAPLCLDMSRDLWIELHAQDTHKHIWDLRYLSEQRQKGPRSQVLHCSARFNMFDPHDAQICGEFARYSRLVSHHHCTELLNDPNISEIIQGRNVYRTFAEIVDYSEPYRGVQKLVGSDNESAGRVVKRYTGQTWADTCLCDSFSQVGGFWVNCMTDRAPSDMYLASGMERWMRSPIYADPATPRPDTWDILARHEQRDDYYTSDIFVFDPTTGQLVEIFLGMKYTKVKKATFSKIIGEFMPRCATRSSDGGKPQLAVSHPAVPAPEDAGAKSKQSQQSSRINLTARVKAVVANFCAMDPNEIMEDGNMADAGVDSLMAMELAREMEEAFQCTLPAANLMEADTFRDLVDCVKAAVGECDNDEQDNSNWSLEDTSSKDSSPDRGFNTPNTEPGTSVASDTPDLELPLRSVLEAFGETKALTDRFLEENKCSGRIQIFAPLQIELCITLTLEAFEQLGCYIRTASRGQCLDRIPFDPQHQELVDYLYKRLEEAELVHLDGNTVIRTAIPAPNKSSLSILEEIKCSYPEYSGASKLAYFTGSKLASVLRGEQDGLQLIFGTKEGQELVSWMYGDEPHNIVGYLQMIDFTKRLIKKVLIAGTEVGPLRILEMGAGTGGGTKWFLPVLSKLDIPVEYTFTDISTAFIAQARRRFKEHSFVRYRVHDIEKPPADDLVGTQHIIIASNAVHATSNLQESTRNMRAALRPDGVVLMLEMTRPAFAIDIVFGLFRGWWVFNDGRNHAITNERRWEADMHTVGYGHVDWTDGHSPEVSVQRVIFATATGTQSQRLPLGSPIERVHPENQADNSARNKVITEYIRRSIEDFTPPTASRSGFGLDGQVVLLTGATGSLGCHIMAHLARQQSVGTIFCLNRTKGNDEPLERQTSALKKRGICLAAHELSKVKVLGATTYHSNLGLSSEQYDTLKTTVTHIIHNAWPMNGASDISGFVKQFQVMRHLVDLANDIACHRRKDSGVRFQFVSSIATVGHYPSITSQNIVPEQSTNIEFVLPNGYSEAKFICERILEETLQRYPNRFQAMIVRPGQISGCSSSGCWKIAEHFPAIVKSAQTLKLLPDLQGALSWTPVNEVAASLVELLVTDNTPFPVYHLDNPVRQRWHNMIALLASELGIPTSSIVPFSEWIQRVRSYPGSAEDNPARLMADWLEENFERMSCGGVLLETTRAKEHSSTLARVGPVSDETARRYLHNWKQCGFLH